MVEHFVPPTVRIGAPPAQKKERQEKLVAQRAEIAPKPDPVPSSSPRFAWSQACNDSQRAIPLHHFRGRMASDPGNTRLPSPQSDSAPADQRDHPAEFPTLRKASDHCREPHRHRPAGSHLRAPRCPGSCHQAGIDRRSHPNSEAGDSRRCGFGSEPPHSPAKTAVSRPRDRRCVSYIRSIRMSALEV